MLNVEACDLRPEDEVLLALEADRSAIAIAKRAWFHPLCETVKPCLLILVAESILATI